jgi:ribosomal protein S24E
MEIEIKKQRETPLLSRTRATLTLNYESATPNRLEIRKAVAHKLKAKEELVVIKHIYTRFGQKMAKVIAHIYNDKKEMEAIERPFMMKKHGAKKAESEAAAEPAKAAA